jgi:hypothetical protein
LSFPTAKENPYRLEVLVKKNSEAENALSKNVHIIATSVRNMVTLYQLAQKTEPGDRIRWVGEDSDVEKPKPRTVRRVILAEGYIVVEAEGPGDGQARLRVEEDGTSEAWYGGDEESMGPVEKAELVDKDKSTEPWS